MRDIRNQQRSTKMKLKMPLLERLVKNKCRGLQSDVRFEADALLALMEKANYGILKTLDTWNRYAIYRERVTITRKDL